jgi:hypothetical protein
MALPSHYRVGEGLLAGEYPGAGGAVEALERAGVTLFVDLTHAVDPLDGYEHRLAGAHRVWHPIPNMGTPTSEQVAAILDDVDEARARGGTVYLHCWGGIGRTGTVVGCWLVRHGLDRGDAIATIAELRRRVAGERPSPETPGQEALVRSWRPGQ